MRITKRQLRRIIKEERGNYPMSQYADIESGEDTTKRRPELQAILDAANAAHGTVPYRVLKNFFWELNSSYATKRKIMEKKNVKITKRQLRRIIKEVHPDYEGLPQSDIDYYELADDYAVWAKQNGHVTPAAASVMATYFLEKGLEDDHKKHEMLGKAFGVEHDNIMADIRRQKAERSAMMGESKMKITKRQLKKIIREEKEKLLIERGTGNPALKDAERSLMRATVEFVDQYRLAMGFDPNDFGDDKRVRRTIDDIIGGILGDM